MVGEKGFEPSTPLVTNYKFNPKSLTFLTLFKCEKQPTQKVTQNKVRPLFNILLSLMKINPLQNLLQLRSWYNLFESLELNFHNH